MASSDKYISELTPKNSNEITGTYSFVIQEPSGQDNSTYRIEVSQLVDWIVSNTNYTEVYDLPVFSSGDDTIVSVGGGSPWTSVLYLRASNESVGIGTGVPTSKLEVFSSDSTNGDIMVNAENGDRMGFHVVPSDDSSPSTPAYIYFGRRIFGSDANFVSLFSLDENGNVVFNLNDSNAITTTLGYSQLGSSSAPEVKMIKLTGTTGASAGDSVSIAHGLTQSKIISCSVLVWNSSLSNWISSNDLITDNSYYTFRIGATNLVVTLGETSPDLSAAITSANIVCTIIYEK